MIRLDINLPYIEEREFIRHPFMTSRPDLSKPVGYTVEIYEIGYAKRANKHIATLTLDQLVDAWETGDYPEGVSRRDMDKARKLLLAAEMAFRRAASKPNATYAVCEHHGLEAGRSYIENTLPATAWKPWAFAIAGVMVGGFLLRPRRTNPPGGLVRRVSPTLDSISR